jgi:hypothetical protein
MRDERRTLSGIRKIVWDSPPPTLKKWNKALSIYFQDTLYEFLYSLEDMFKLLGKDF